MSEQPEALRLADMFEAGNCGYPSRAAAELRRLHEAHEWQYKMAGERLRRIEKLEALNAELLGLLKRAGVVINDTAYGGAVFRKEVRDVMDAIAKATGEQA